MLSVNIYKLTTMSINKLQVIIIDSFSKKEFNSFNKIIRIKLYSSIFLNNCYNFFYLLFVYIRMFHFTN